MSDSQSMSLAWMTADCQNHCFILSSQLGNGTKMGRGSGIKMCWNCPSRPKASQLMSANPCPRTGQPGGQQYIRAPNSLRKAGYRAWMKRGWQEITECQTPAPLYPVSSAAKFAPSGFLCPYVQTCVTFILFWNTENVDEFLCPLYVHFI